MWDCLLGALKAHEETSAHDYQGWLQARPIREDIKKYFDLLHSQIMICSYLAFLLVKPCEFFCQFSIGDAFAMNCSLWLTKLKQVVELRLNQVVELRLQ